MSGATVGRLASVVSIAARPRSLPALIPLRTSAFPPTLLLHRHRIPLVVCCCPCSSSSAMGSASPEAAGKEIEKLESKEEPRPPPVAPPAKSPPVTLTPPEKPEPGDCCGSGCVRCVWDIYYEELEAYNKNLAAAGSGDGL